jgi:hypothetical protein
VADEERDSQAESEESADAPEMEDASGTDDSGDAIGEGWTLAPDWQEELLAESAKADQLVSWYYDQEEEDEDLIWLRSEMRCKTTLHISEVYEVYYETTPGVWERIYHSNRVMRDYREGLVWTDGYAPSDYNMMRSGHYRLVRQVGPYRQVVGLSLTVK